jgi:hypothetical protein
MNLMKHPAVVIIMALLISSCAQHVPISDESQRLYKGFTNVVDQTSHGNRVVIYRFGSPPVKLQKNVILINGYRLDVYQSGQKDTIFCESGGEIDPDVIIDLKDFKKGVIRTTSTTQDPRWPEKKNIPFVEETIQILPQGQNKISHKLVLEPEPFDPKRIDKLFSEIIALSKQRHDDDAAATTVSRNLAHIRSMSIHNPDAILKRLKSLPSLPGDCSCGHTISGFMDEVELIQMIQQGK